MPLLRAECRLTRSNASCQAVATEAVSSRSRATNAVQSPFRKQGTKSFGSAKYYIHFAYSASSAANVHGAFTPTRSGILRKRRDLLPGFGRTRKVKWSYVPFEGPRLFGVSDAACHTPEGIVRRKAKAALPANDGHGVPSGDDAECATRPHCCGRRYCHAAAEPGEGAGCVSHVCLGRGSPATRILCRPRVAALPGFVAARCVGCVFCSI